MDNCTSCTGKGGIFSVIAGKICFICLDYIRYKAGYKLDDIHELENNNIKKIIAITRQTEKILLEEQRANKRNSSKTS